MTGAREYELRDADDVTPDLPPAVEAPEGLPGRPDRDGGDGDGEGAGDRAEDGGDAAERSRAADGEGSRATGDGGSRGTGDGDGPPAGRRSGEGEDLERQHAPREA
jgi:hypothetical protein